MSSIIERTVDSKKLASVEYSEFYDEMLGPFFFTPPAEDLVNRVIKSDVASTPLHLISSILEIGCGTGRTTCVLRTVFQFDKMVALDISPNMQEIARKAVRDVEEKTGGSFLHPVEFQIGSALELSDLSGEETFDIVVMQFVLMFVDHRTVLQEIFKVLSLNGRVYFSTWDAQNSMIFSQAFIDIRSVNEAVYQA